MYDPNEKVVKQELEKIKKVSKAENRKLNVYSVKGRMEVFEDFVQKQREILLGKGSDYTAGRADEDAYANFRIIADLMKGAPWTPMTVAMVYELKHLLSIVTFAKTGRQESGEGLEGRFLDRANYTFIERQLVPDHLEHFRKDGGGFDRKLEEGVEALNSTEVVIAAVRFVEGCNSVPGAITFEGFEGFDHSDLNERYRRLEKAVQVLVRRAVED